MPILCAPLRTAEIEVDSDDAAASLSLTRNVEQFLRIVARKVRHHRAVVHVTLEQVDTTARRGELICSDHWSVAQLCAMPSSKQSKGKLTAADHWSQYQLMRRQQLAWRRKRDSSRQRKLSRG